jgi:hypothetical protein
VVVWWCGGVVEVCEATVRGDEEEEEEEEEEERDKYVPLPRFVKPTRLLFTLPLPDESFDFNGIGLCSCYCVKMA